MRSTTQCLRWTYPLAVLCAVVFALVRPAASLAEDVSAAPYDVVHNALQPYMSATDPHAFPMKVASLTDSRFKFWRGGKDLFYHWVKANATDWLADGRSVVIGHGDVHPGNVGAYAIGPNRLAFGLVDFDDSARMPFQVELLDTLVSLEETADANRLKLSSDDRTTVASELFDAYVGALRSQQTATEILRDDELVKRLVGHVDDQYSELLKKYVGDDGALRPTIGTKKKLKEILRPATADAGAIANGLAASIENSHELRSALRPSTVSDVRAAIKDVALRTRVGSSGSQGLKKYLVPMSKPLNGFDGDAILYLKQQIPAAPERAGAVARDLRTPGKRCVEDMSRVLDPRPWVCAAIEFNGESYWLSVFEPWGDELDPDEVKDLAEMRRFARLCGTALGTAHRGGGDANAIIERLTPECRDLIRTRTAACRATLAAEYTAFTADPRALADVATANAAIKAVTNDGKNP
jgi:uncharacterized protein (DUF2252 family)